VDAVDNHLRTTGGVDFEAWEVDGLIVGGGGGVFFVEEGGLGAAAYADEGGGAQVFLCELLERGGSCGVKDVDVDGEGAAAEAEGEPDIGSGVCGGGHYFYGVAVGLVVPDNAGVGEEGLFSSGWDCLPAVVIEMNRFLPVH